MTVTTSRHNAETMWSLLPEHLRTQDGGFLRGLIEVLGAEADLVDDDINALQDDWFIETCEEWLVPYIAELVGSKVLHTFAGAGVSNRARIADTLRYRRRKGTAAMLEELARSATGWPARALEFFEVLSTTQHLNHVRLYAPATASVRNADAMELVGGPFDPTSHTVDVRPMRDVLARRTPEGRYNLANVGLFVWPSASYPLDRATAVALADPHDGRFVIDPLGADRPLASPTVVEGSIDHRAGESNVPGNLRRRPLHDELDAVRAAPADSTLQLEWFSADDPAFEVWIQATANADLVRVHLDELFVGDLSGWSLPTGSQVRVDPVLGRVAVTAARQVHRLAVSSAYAFTGDIGAGPYPRPDASDDGDDGEPDFQIGVSVTDDAVPSTVVPALADAVAEWHTWQTAYPNTIGRIVLMDSHRYVESFTGPNAVTIAQGNRLTIVAARWPAPKDGPRQRGGIELADVRPCVRGDLEVVGAGTGERPGELWLDGVLLDGAITITTPSGSDDGLGVLGLRNSTVVPGRGGIDIHTGNDRITVMAQRSITGPITLTGDRVDLSISDSVVDAGEAPATAAITAAGADAVIIGSTILGTAELRTLSSSDTIFDDGVEVARRQQGCVRFCYVTPGSLTPRRYRCQPDLAVEQAPGDPGVEARLEPAYVSMDLGHPGYARLADHAAAELLSGAESGSEMGAFGFQLRPQRLANLLEALDEYLPFGRVAAPLPVQTHQGALP